MAKTPVYPIREFSFFFFTFFYFFSVTFIPMPVSTLRQYSEYLRSLKIASSEYAVPVLDCRLQGDCTAFPNQETKGCLHTCLLYSYLYRQCYPCRQPSPSHPMLFL
jgi:hypothetical protein